MAKRPWVKTIRGQSRSQNPPEEPIAMADACGLKPVAVILEMFLRRSAGKNATQEGTPIVPQDIQPIVESTLGVDRYAWTLQWNGWEHLRGGWVTPHC